MLCFPMWEYIFKNEIRPGCGSCWETKHYFQSFNLFICNCLLYIFKWEHKSPSRPLTSRPCFWGFSSITFLLLLTFYYRLILKFLIVYVASKLTLQKLFSTEIIVLNKHIILYIYVRLFEQKVFVTMSNETWPEFWN